MVLPLGFKIIFFISKVFVSTHDRLGDVRWKLCVTDTSGKKNWSSADCFNVFKSSVCVRWYSFLPPLSRLKTLQVFAFVPVFFHRNWTPHKNRSVPPESCSLKTIEPTNTPVHTKQIKRNSLISLSVEVKRVFKTLFS